MHHYDIPPVRTVSFLRPWTRLGLGLFKRLEESSGLSGKNKYLPPRRDEAQSKRFRRMAKEFQHDMVVV